MRDHEHFHLASLADEVPYGLRHREIVAVPAEVERAPQRARVPDWVADPVKWQALTRAERRQLERHHAKQARGR